MSIVTNVEDNGRKVTIRISDRFDFEDRVAFREAYEQGTPDSHFIIDMRSLEIVSSCALGMLLLLRDYVNNRRDRVRIVNCAPLTLKLFDAAQFQKVFDIDGLEAPAESTIA